MPARLNVIMIESAPAAGAARRLAESVVGELIGLPGMDLTLVESLDKLTEGSTDKLTLDSISGDVCVLDWQPPPAIESSLHSVGFLGRRSPHAHDPDMDVSPQDQGSQRRIYAFDLNRFTEAAQLCEALAALRQTLQVRTFSLGAPPALNGSKEKGAKPIRSQAKASAANGHPVSGKQGDSGGPRQADPSRLADPSRSADPRAADPQQGKSNSSAEEPSPARRSPDGARDRAGDLPQQPARAGQIDLDDLVDQLDQFDS
tara:strand:- start:21913 stop:22689 length:777 start_codon:yes stop_codon:yes gene_type:complete